jgi:flagellar protein FlgJ
MSQQQQDFVKKYSNLVQQLTAGTGIFPETIFSQAIVESQKNGKIPGTQLSIKYNNYFGIKDSAGWTGKVINMNTGEVYNGKSTVVTAGFRAYNTPEDSFKDYIHFLKTNARYAPAFTAKTYTEQIHEIANAGYATNPGYSALLNNIANSITTYITPYNVGLGILFIGILSISFYYYYNKS